MSTLTHGREGQKVLKSKIDYVYYDSVGVTIPKDNVSLTFDFEMTDTFRASKKTLKDFQNCKVEMVIGKVGAGGPRTAITNLGGTPMSTYRMAEDFGMQENRLKGAIDKATHAFLKQFE